MSAASQPPSRLARRLGLRETVLVGLGAMIGAGIFAAPGPAARAAGGALLLGLALAGAVAWCNADSSARLAALYPESGGAYVYGRRRLGEVWGYLAGVAFVAGKLASCAAMALTFGHYAAPEEARPLALAAVAGLTAVNLRGIGKTAAASAAIVAVVLAALAVFVVAALGGGDLDAARLAPGDAGPLDVLRAGGILFFAFAGYARVATLGEEVADPARTIPRGIALSLAIALAVYAVVVVAALLSAGPERLAGSARPLRAAIDGTGWAVPAVAIGAAAASLGVLLSLLAGVSRTVYALADDGYLPRPLARVDARRGVPRGAELAVAVAVAALVLAADLGFAIGFSSFCVLWYYAVANASAWTLGGRRAVPALGLAGCVALAVSLPPDAAGSGAVVLAAGALLYLVLAARRR